MPYIKIGDLTTFTGDTSGSWIVMNDETNATTYKVQKETYFTSSLYGTASYALTASYVANASSFPYTGSAAISGSLNVIGPVQVTGNLTASNALFTGNITAQTLVVQTITSSVEYVTGSTKFGTLSTDTHQFTGSVGITGSLTMTSGVASLTASNALTASYVAASSVVGLNLSQISSGSVSASVNVNSVSFQITSGSSTLLFVSSSGNVSIGTNLANSNIIFQVNGGSKYVNYNAAYLSGNFYTYQAFGTWDAYGSDASTASILALGGFRSSQWIGMTLHTNGAERLRIFSNGNIAINTTTDSGHKLLVSGSGPSGSLNVDNTLYVSGSRVGVGTSSPGCTLNIVGGTNWSAGFYEIGRFVNSSLKGVSLGYDNNSYTGTIAANTDGTASNLSFWTYPGTGGLAERMKILANGNVRIGTTLFSDTSSPMVIGYDGVSGARLSIANNSSYQDILFVNTSISSGNINNWGFGQRWDTYFGNTIGSFQIVGAYVNNSGVFSTVGGGYRVPLIANPNGDIILAGASANAVNGNVGIGTTSPSFKLDVSGSTRITNNLTVTGSTQLTGSLGVTGSLSVSGSATLQGNLTTNLTAGSIPFIGTSGLLSQSNSNLFWDATNNRLGVGITTPSELLEISAGNIQLSNAKSIRFRYTNGTAFTVLQMFSDNNTYLDAASDINFRVNAAATTAMIAKSSGNILINTATDSGYKLLVSGSGTAGSLNVNNTLYVSGSNVSITGSLGVTGSVNVRSIANTISGSTLTVYGSGSSQPVFTVQGSQGELFSVNDSLSGSLFSVNDISGLPVLEAFSDNRVLIGSYQAPALYTTVKVSSVAGNNVIYQNLPTASYDGVFVSYTARSGSNGRVGQLTGMWSASAVLFTEFGTSSFGDTTGLGFTMIVTGSNMAVTASTTTANWNIKTIIRSI